MRAELHFGDCLDVMKDIPDKSVDMILSDPPYGISYSSNMRVKSDKFSVIDNDNNDARFLVYSDYYRVLKDDRVAVVFCSWKNIAYDYIELKKYFDIKNVIVWDKGGGGIGDLAHSLLTDYELAIVCHKGKCRIRGKRDGSVWDECKVNPNKMVHPTQKPVKLLERIIEKYSDKDSVVLDTFMGSGSTGVACVNTNRNFIGIELNKKYFEIAKERIDESGRNKAIHLI